VDGIHSRAVIDQQQLLACYQIQKQKTELCNRMVLQRMSRDEHGMIRVRVVVTVRTRIGDVNVVANTESQDERDDRRLRTKNEGRHTSDERSIRDMISCIAGDKSSINMAKKCTEMEALQDRLLIAALIFSVDITHYIVLPW
jgi:hypothetical protein